MARCVVLVIDSGGIGALPDAESYGDAASVDTIGNTSRALGGLHLPHLASIGLGGLTAVRGLAEQASRPARTARLAERSAGKDTVTGHWEMTGITTEIAFPTFPGGFPPDVVERFTEITGKPPLGNTAASGTEIIAELGAEHMATGRPILYTSADSVFQVAAHEDVVPVATLHRWCEEAREMLTGAYRVNRVIARPFVGRPGAFTRTANRHDYAVSPPPNLLDRLASERVAVHGVGKIGDIFSGRGLQSSTRVADNDEAMHETLRLLEEVEHGFVFTNLNDFDSKYGHRRDVRGYGAALECFDQRLAGVFDALRPGDVGIITADHGCDPTAPGTDHTREHVPFLAFGTVEPSQLGIHSGFSLVGETVERVLVAG